jgi:hypothetical protein
LLDNLLDKLLDNLLNNLKNISWAYMQPKNRFWIAQSTNH